MPRIRIFVLITGLCSVACFHIGPTAADFPLASLPNGVTVSVQTTGQSAAGELLAVRDDGIVILHGSRLAFAPYASLRSAKVAELTDYSIGAGAPPLEQRTKLNAVSRYPQGIGPALQQKLLSQAGQTEMDVLR
ncbi:MAG: hypothetical protein M3Z54_08225 [Gemmatimonadota bacterium]|nr:hypothetical protein [Gemmatimonadota bacterium]